MQAEVRTSSAVLATRGCGRGREVLLVERAQDLAFFGGYWSVPGGALDGGDRRAAAGNPALARAHCALRELFEETGVLTGAQARELSPAERSAVRRSLLEGRDEPRWWRSLERAPAALDELRPVATLTTPAFVTRRHRTTFFHLELGSDARADVWPGELVRGQLVRPERALDEWRAGQRLLAPPILYFLELWEQLGFEPALERFGRESRRVEAGALRPARSTPGIATVPLRTPTVPPATTTNCYLVGEERVWIVDPATYEREERERLFELVDRWRDEGRELAGVLVTHHHADHVGSVAAVSRRYGLEVHGHPATLARLPDTDLPLRALEDGDALELGRAPDGSPGWMLRAYHTPGHDRGHLAFRDGRYGALVAGDLVSTLSTIVIDPPEGHLRTYLASLARMAQVGIGVIHPAHGPAHADGEAVLHRFLAHRRMREEALVRALTRGARRVDELVDEVYAGTAPELRALARRSLYAGLEKLAEDGRARPCGARWEAVPAPGA